MVSGAILKTVEHPSKVQLVAFSPDGSKLVTASDDHENTVYVTDLESGALIANI